MKIEEFKKKDVNWVICTDGKVYIYWEISDDKLLLKTRAQDNIYVKISEIQDTCNVRDLKNHETPEEYFKIKCPEFDI